MMEEEGHLLKEHERDVEDDGDEDEEDVDEEDGERDSDDDGYMLHFDGGIDPLALVEQNSPGDQPYQHFQKLKNDTLAKVKHKMMIDERSDGLAKKPRQDKLFGASMDEIMEVVDFGSKRKRGKLKKRGRRKGSKNKLSPEVISKLGEANLLYAFGRYDEAIGLLKEVIRIAPNVSDTYHTLGLVHTAIGDRNKAFNFYMIAAHLNLKDVYLWKRLVNWSRELGHVEQAIYCLSKAIAAEPDDMSLGFSRASLYVELGDYQKAAESISQILEVHPANSDACRMSAEMYLTCSQVDKAVNILETFISGHAEEADPSLVRLLVNIHMDNKAYKEALNCIDKAQSVHWAGSELPLYLRVKAGICYACLGNILKSEALLKDLVNGPPDECADLIFEVAECMMLNQNYHIALKYLLSLRESCKNDTGNLDAKIAECYLHLKEYEKAISFFYRVVSAREDNVAARLTLASLLSSSNREDEAIEVLSAPEVSQHSADHKSEGSASWWLDVDVRLKLAKILLAKGRVAEFIDSIYSPIHETLLMEAMNNKVRLRRKLPKRVLCERIKLLDEKQPDGLFRGFRPIASSSDLVKASRARKKLQEMNAEKERKMATALTAGLEWQSDDSDDEPSPAFQEPPFPNLLKDEEQYALLVELCKALASLQQYGEELEIINYTLKVGETALSAEKKEQLRSMGARVAYKTRDPTYGYDYARHVVQQRPYSIAAWNCYYKVVSRLENRFPKHAKFLLFMRGKLRDCVPPMMISGHQSTAISQHQIAAKDYLEAFKVEPENPLINLCAGTALINLALGCRVRNWNQCVVQGFAFLYNYLQLCDHCQEALYNVARAYHHVGLVTLAAAYYEKVLITPERDYPIPKLPNEEANPSEIKRKGYCSLHREAAFNLHLIYKSSGALDLARQVLRDYCTD